MVALLKSVVGNQVNVDAPEAVRVVLVPVHKVVVPLTVITGNEITVNVAVAVLEQPLVVPVTVYVVVELGVAIGLATVDELNPVVGNQL